MPLTVGGGVREVGDIRELLKAGADKVSINTAAVQNPEFVREAAERFGSQCIVVAIDAKRSTPAVRWEVFTHGGRTPTGLDAIEWARRMEGYGAGEILLTSMDRDGTKLGYDLALTRAIARRRARPGHRFGRRRNPRAHLRGPHGRRRRPPRSRHRSSTTASTPSAKSSATSPSAASRCARSDLAEAAARVAGSVAELAHAREKRQTSSITLSTSASDSAQ